MKQFNKDKLVKVLRNHWEVKTCAWVTSANHSPIFPESCFSEYGEGEEMRDRLHRTKLDDVIIVESSEWTKDNGFEKRTLAYITFDEEGVSLFRRGDGEFKWFTSWEWKDLDNFGELTCNIVYDICTYCK